MQVTKGTWRMREQCVPSSLSSSPAREPGNEANQGCAGLKLSHELLSRFCSFKVLPRVILGSKPHFKLLISLRCTLVNTKLPPKTDSEAPPT